jgi:hypothetical protein
MSVRQKDFAIPDIEALEARLYFKSFYGEENLSLRTQLDITQFDRIYPPVQSRRLIHPYSDSSACAAMIMCHKLEEILASKLATQLHRRNPADLFDLLYAIVFRDQFGVNRREVITTFLRKSIFENEPSAAREQLRAVPVRAFRDLWKSVVAPVASLFNFDFVVANFYGLIDALFALVIAPPQPTPASAGVGAPRVIRPSGGFSRSMGTGLRNYFSSDVRNIIIEAGRSRMMVRLAYDGYARAVEPYKLELRAQEGWTRTRILLGVGHNWRQAARSASNNSSATKYNRCSQHRSHFSLGMQSNFERRFAEDVCEVLFGVVADP